MIIKTVSALPGLKFSAIGFGCWSLGGASGWTDATDDQSIATIRHAVACGITFFDTAPVYGFGTSEVVLGKALAGLRDKVILASKCGLIWDNKNNISNDLSPKAVLADVEASLKRLGTDHLDILQLHWPDPAVPLEETAKALRQILESGKARAIGVSNFSRADAEKIATMIPIASYQGLYNLLERDPETYHGITLAYRTESEILPLCRDKGYAFFPYSPLFQGLLTGKFPAANPLAKGDIRAGNPKLSGPLYAKYHAACEDLKPITAKASLSLTHLALGWLIGNPAVTSIICGARTPQQIEDNARAGDVTLSSETRADIAEVLRRHGV